MKLSHPSAELYIPDGRPPAQAYARTTHLGIGAHPDDLEFMTWWAILRCFQSLERGFTGVTVTDGRGSSRVDEYAGYSDDEMRSVRLKEQKRAAMIGDYAALVCLDYSSAEVRSRESRLVEDLIEILEATRPREVYTHNLADKHETHVAVTLAVIQALRSCRHRPDKVYGCEVWRCLDWMLDTDKVVFDVSAHENLTMSLMGVYDSQIAGGKRYDLATQGRKRANATYHMSHAADRASCLELAMDMTALLEDPSLDPAAFVLAHVDRFRQDVELRIGRLSQK
ncbi:PIG-L family deacetylase [bacterium CPR1]|nr:PIG-L family deacetylase [bacterium CPR1]